MPDRAINFEIPDRQFDLLVVGLGPAGVACALQAHRDGLDVLAVGDESIGGLVRAARKLTNLPAEPEVSGAELAVRMVEQIEALRVPVILGHVRRLSAGSRGYRAELGDGRQVDSRAVTLATGTRPRDWNLSVGGRPVHRDARSLPESLNGEVVAVIGGGEAALDTALTCRDRGARVILLARGERLRSVARLVEEAREAGVEIRCGTTLNRVSGGPGGWILHAGPAGQIEASLLMVCIGREPRDELLQELVPDGCRLGVTQAGTPGLTLAGDLIRGRERYVATAMGDGQRAAIATADYLAEVEK